jgi:cytoskeletal protein CcmA (bactofilin family)
MSTEQLKTIVSKDTVLEGVLKSMGQLDVYGKVIGEIECEALVVYAGASVQGKVQCGNAEIRGEVRTQEDFCVRGTLIVRGGAGVWAQNVRYGDLVVDAGAKLQGGLIPSEMASETSAERPILNALSDSSALSGAGLDAERAHTGLGYPERSDFGDSGSTWERPRPMATA